MRFNVPQFIERESKIVGPLSLKQFAYFAIAGGICFFIYFTAPIYIFLLSVVFFGGIAFALAFVKVNGRSLPVIIMNMIKFSFSSKVYLWEKKKDIAPPPIIGIPQMKKEEEKEEKYKLTIGNKSSLGNLKNKIEIK